MAVNLRLACWIYVWLRLRLLLGYNLRGGAVCKLLLRLLLGYNLRCGAVLGLGLCHGGVTLAHDMGMDAGLDPPDSIFRN